MASPILCLINQKGGCGKSSTSFHLAGHFAQVGQRVLLVDADPQASLSQGFLGSSLVETLHPNETTAAPFADDMFFRVDISLSKPTPIDGIFLVPANQSLARHNIPCPETQGLAQLSLRTFLRQLPGFDIVLIDCPPNLYQCSWNAMLAADFVLIPVPPEDFGTQGLCVVHQAIENARQLNPHLQLLGHLVTRFDRRLTVHHTYEQRLRKLYGSMVLDTVIPEASAFKVSLACRQPVTHYSRNAKAACLTRNLGYEILQRIGRQIKRSVA